MYTLQKFELMTFSIYRKLGAPVFSLCTLVKNKNKNKKKTKQNKDLLTSPNVSYTQGKAVNQRKEEQLTTSYDSPGKYVVKCNFRESMLWFILSMPGVLNLTHIHTGPANK